MQPKKFSEYTPITETDGSEVIPILKAGVNATVKSEDLPISTATQTAIDAADADIAAHVADVANPHQVTKTQVGLGNADNTSDANKPVSTAQATAIALKADTTYVDSQDALKADQATTYTKTEVDTRDTDVADTAQTNLTAHTSNTSNPHSTTKAQVGLGNVDNTSDADKPVSTATQTALDGKANFPSTDSHVPVRDGTGAQSSLRYTSGTTGYTIGFRTADGQIGVGAPTDNTHATNKGYVDTALNGKANFPTSNTNVPVRDASGNQGQLPYDTGISNSSIVRRTGTGTIQGATATVNTELTTKLQMDAADALKVNKAGDTMTGLLISQSIFPSTTTTYNIGSTTFRYSNIWGQRLNVNGTTYIDGATGDRLDITAPAGFRINGVGYITGTGFPNGVVSAPVGSKYIDKNATNGALEWMKATGTGNTGWVVSVGDTGWRDVSSSANGFSSGILRVKRKDNTVAVTLVDLVLGTNSGSQFDYYTLPSGFGASQWQFSALDQSQVYKMSLATGGVLRIYSLVASTKISGSLNFDTNAAWPTTLPGTAV